MFEAMKTVLVFVFVFVHVFVFVFEWHGGAMMDDGWMERDL